MPVPVDNQHCLDRLLLLKSKHKKIIKMLKTYKSWTEAEKNLFYTETIIWGLFLFSVYRYVKAVTIPNTIGFVIFGLILYAVRKMIRAAHEKKEFNNEM